MLHEKVKGAVGMLYGKQTFWIQGLVNRVMINILLFISVLIQGLQIYLLIWMLL